MGRPGSNLQGNLSCLNSCTHTLSSPPGPFRKDELTSFEPTIGSSPTSGVWGSVSDAELESGRGSPAMLRDTGQLKMKMEVEKRGGEA